MCGLDPRHVALQGTEMRACWEAADTTGTMGLPEDGPDGPVRVPVLAASVEAVAAGNRPIRTFVPVESLAPGAVGAAASRRPGPVGQPFPGTGIVTTGDERLQPQAIRARRIPGGWSLWGDFEP